jgi:3-oxoacyl-[acyl-carrier protein] reductase
MESQLSYLPLAGKTAVVTGPSRGIGAGIALELATRGANVGSETPCLTLKTEYRFL